MAILASESGMLVACTLIRETKGAWIVNYKDKKYPNDVRVPKNGPRQLFNSVDEAFGWLGMSEGTID